MNQQLWQALIMALGAFALGACIGSFLNVVIYRVPRNLSVNLPRRSFCPNCKRPIPWWENIPLLSWWLLRGKCKGCDQRIPFRYWLVEAFTALLFLFVWGHYGMPKSPAYWIFVSMLVSATFIDLDFYIIPLRISIGGGLIGIACCGIWPELMEQTSWYRGLLISLFSAAVALGVLWCVVELGKLAFGRKKLVFEPAETWSITQMDLEMPYQFRLGSEEYDWEELFNRPKDILRISCIELEVNERQFNAVEVELTSNLLRANGETFLLEEINSISGKTTGVVIPREAMGFGDVYFLAMIGAFLGWKAILFVIAAASLIGTFMAVIPRLLRKVKWSAQIPFGPYLAVGSLLWLFYGPQLMDWYFGLLHRE